jgi:hypothetical protein
VVLAAASDGWYVAELAAPRQENKGDCVDVHYVGWAASHDEANVSFSSGRLVPVFADAQVYHDFLARLRTGTHSWRCDGRKDGARPSSYHSMRRVSPFATK